MKVAIFVLVLATYGAEAGGAMIGDSGDRSEAPGTLVWVGKHRLHLNCMGTGSPTVVFDSGLGGSSLDWVRVHAKVASFTRACTYDRAGYGWSDAGPLPRDSMHISDELKTLLGNASVPAPYLLVGHSFGGFNVRLFSRDNPQQVAGLVLVDASHEDQFRRFDEAGMRTSAPRGRTFIVGNAVRIPDSMPAEVMPLAQSFAVTRRSMMAFRSELEHLRRSAGQLSYNAAIPDIPVVVISHRIGSPAAAAHKALREKIWMDLQSDLVRRAAQGIHVVADTKDHYVHLSQPDLVVDTIRNVIARLDGAH